MMELNCVQCDQSFEAKSKKARFCSAKCRKAAFKARKVEELSREQSGNGLGGVTESVRAELLAAGRLDSYLGASALALATQIDRSTAVMGFAALVKELRVTMAAAMDGAQVETDAVDELAARRNATLAG